MEEDILKLFGGAIAVIVLYYVCKEVARIIFKSDNEDPFNGLKFE
jgi:hypothetical protein